MIIKVTIFLSALLILTGCVTELEETGDNRPPEIEKALTDVSIIKDGSIDLSLKHLEAFDEDGDEMTLLVFGGENYTLEGLRIIPKPGFVGDLYVKVQITDGELYSDIVTLIISVVSNVELFPLLENSWWEYRDSIPGNDRVLSSKLEVQSVDSMTIGAEKVSMSTLTWSNLSSYNFSYQMYTSDTGTILYGGMSSTDTLVDPQLLYYYPTVVGKSWDYTTLKYNATDGEFFKGENAQMLCSDSSVYITVPAGIFECIELKLSYTVKASSLISSSGLAFTTAEEVPIVEKHYYSPGVGYVKNITTIEGVTVWKKELVTYHVKQENE